MLSSISPADPAYKKRPLHDQSEVVGKSLLWVDIIFYVFARLYSFCVTFCLVIHELSLDA